MLSPVIPRAALSMDGTGAIIPLDGQGWRAME